MGVIVERRVSVRVLDQYLESEVWIILFRIREAPDFHAN
jgi:hypothetical protein